MVSVVIPTWALWTFCVLVLLSLPLLAGIWQLVLRSKASPVVSDNTLRILVKVIDLIANRYSELEEHRNRLLERSKELNSAVFDAFHALRRHASFQCGGCEACVACQLEIALYGNVLRDDDDVPGDEWKREAPK